MELRPGLWVKSELGYETGTFKDRGAAVMMGLAAELDAAEAVVDSSGNAGRAAAWFGARYRVPVTVFVPETTAPAAVQAIEELGAVVVAGGDRAGAAAAAQARVGAGVVGAGGVGAGGARAGAWYASHVYQPAFHHGVKTLAFELAQEVGSAGPGTVVVPAGNGTLVLGLWLGFCELMGLGRLGSMPRLVAVQAARCAPIAGLEPTGPTAATGIHISRPPRLGQVRAAVLASGGSFLTADESALEPAQADLARRGFAGVSITSSVVWAALELGERAPGPAPVVVVLSGRG